MDISIVEMFKRLENEIIHYKGDDEAQHATEDEMLKLFVDVCLCHPREIIEELREIILRVRGMDFSRWCA